MNRKCAAILLTLGLLLTLAALGVTGYNLWDDHRAGVEAEQVLEVLLQHRKTAGTASHTPSEAPVELEQTTAKEPERELSILEIDGNRYIGTISVPALELELPVLENWDLALLKIAPCRYMGSPYQGNFILCAHNYSTHFGRLKNLRSGDAVIFTDMAGKTFRYTVAETDTLPGNAVEEMESGGWDLTLFTCTTNGQTRFTVRCKLTDAGERS